MKNGIHLNHKGTCHDRGVEDKEGLDALKELALDLIWSWNHNTDTIWKELDFGLWEMTHNPWVVLQTVSQEKLKQKLADPIFRKELDRLVQQGRKQAEGPGWFQKQHSDKPLTRIAYFSMEFMLSEALPIYSGGLGNVAGDQLKAASDLGVPVIGIGLLYQQGYFRQIIDKDGQQQPLYPYNDPGQLPITPLRKSNGEWLRLEVTLPGWSLWLRAWHVQVGKANLFLLDSNDAANYPAHRGITSELYGGNAELRLKQELVLGIGGWRLLKELGIAPEVCHLNEGHAAFAILERAKDYMNQTGESFETALSITRAGNLFTTHTAVPAGFDRFSPDLIQQYLSNYATKQLKISVDDLLALGRLNPHDPQEFFNMAYLAIRGCGAINGVSELHGKVSRQIFEPLFTRWPEEEIPVGYITNGVHMPSWDSSISDELWCDACGKTRWLNQDKSMQEHIQKLPNEQLWKMRNDSRQYLVIYARDKATREAAARGASQEEIETLKHLFDPHTLTLGFARRFATYKRPNMLLHDPDRLLRILNNPQRPVQLIIAGKAHPADKPGQALIQQWIHFIRRTEARNHVIFLSDYDMLITQKLVRGVDVWINTPQRPWEACGTSGMKVLVNGGINVSELDGWWAEAYTPEVGWALGDGKEHGSDPAWTAAEANALYDIIENEIVPEFYTCNEEGMPTRWVERIKASMSQLTPQFSANRAVREYTEKYYVPLAINYQTRTSDQGSKGKEILQWEKAIKHQWPAVRFNEVKIQTEEDHYLFETRVYLNGLEANSVKVELFNQSLNGDPKHPISVFDMKHIRQLTGNPSEHVYQIEVPKTVPANTYTARIVPCFDHVSVPLEVDQILWQH